MKPAPICAKASSRVPRRRRPKLSRPTPRCGPRRRSRRSPGRRPRVAPQACSGTVIRPWLSGVDELGAGGEHPLHRAHLRQAGRSRDHPIGGRLVGGRGVAIARQRSGCLVMTRFPAQSCGTSREEEAALVIELECECPRTQGPTPFDSVLHLTPLYSTFLHWTSTAGRHPGDRRPTRGRRDPSLLPRAAPGRVARENSRRGDRGTQPSEPGGRSAVRRRRHQVRRPDGDRGQARGDRTGAGGAVRVRSPADRGRPGRRQDDARQGSGAPIDGTAQRIRSPPTCCPATSPACRSSMPSAAPSSSSRAACSPTS